MIPVCHFPFLDFPFIKRLIHDQKPHSIAQVKKLRSRRVMCSANGIAAHVFEQLQTPFPCLLGNGSPKTTCIVVQAHAIHLYVLSVQRKPLVLIVFNRTDTECRAQVVAQRCSFYY